MEVFISTNQTHTPRSDHDQVLVQQPSSNSTNTFQQEHQDTEETCHLCEEVETRERLLCCTHPLH